MPVFKDFSENGELLQERKEQLNAENFERYIKENGAEKAKGYLDALADFTKLFQEMGNNSSLRTSYQVRKLYNNKLELLKSCNNVLSYSTPASEHLLPIS